MKKLIWVLIAILGASAVGGIALNRGESINALWFVTAALCIYAIAYRFYSAWLAAKVMVLDETRATPAERLENGRDFIPTNKWIVFGHHFAAIAGPGPLVGPTLAAQFGYLPGTLWILFGAVLGGCVQDMVILFMSTRRNGRSLGQMARDEIGPIGGAAALIGTFAIMIILIAVLGLVVVNAMKHSPWATSTVAATIPIAMIVGLYMRHFRVGKVLEASALGVALLLLAVVAGGWVDHSPWLNAIFDHEGLTLAWWVIAYGFAAAIMPVWLLLAPRDYLSTFMKLGTIILLTLAIFALHPEVKMPALTQFVDGTGPIFGGKLFPFVFITIACGAISGFHALISSGTTPKLLTNERDIRMIGYGGMLLESFVAIMALIAATVLEPGVFFAINSPAGVVGKEAADAVALISSWGFPVTVEQMQTLATQMGESTLFARTGGAPSLAVGMASIFGSAFGNGMLAMWYHFAIMFEAIFILTTLDAGTRVGRFMLQDMLGNIWHKMADTSWWPSVLMTSAVVVAGWGYFLYIGVIDPNGGVNILWPLFGIANQMLAAIALSVGTGILIKSRKLKFAWVTGAPLAYFIQHPLEIFAVWQGGMSFHGGFLGVLLAMVFFGRKYQKTWMSIMDFVAPLVPIGLGAGRMGNFINGELWGRTTNADWGMVFPKVDTLARHPSQLYEFALEGILLFAILWLYSNKKRPVGAVSGLFLIGYGSFRFLAEFTREPDANLGILSLGMSMGQWLSLPMIVIGLAMFTIAHQSRTV